MSVSNFPWCEGSAFVGGGTVFGEIELPPIVTAGVDGMIDAGADTGTPADLVSIERAAHDVAIGFTLEAMKTALDLGGVDPDKVSHLWRLAASYGAAMAVSRTAGRCLQVRLLVTPGEGEA